MNTPSRRQPLRKSKLSHECLEPRLLLDAEGIIWGADARLTLSFSPDGTLVGEETSALFAQMDPIAPQAEWQSAILKGFQTWARETNGDIGVVTDDGADFAAPGQLRRDPRFGDIRIGSIPLDDQFATSVSSAELIDGTWIGEVLFNSNKTFTVDEVFALAVHEAGHVFGLEHNDDPNSPMHEHSLPTSLAPTPADLLALHGIFGPRSPDVYDLPDEDGGSRDGEPVELPLFRTMTGGDGSAPTVAFADITDAQDVDTYYIETPGDDVMGPTIFSRDVRIAIVTSGISLLTPTMTITTEAGEVIGTTESDYPGTDAVVEISDIVDRQRYEVTVAGAGNEFAIGGYSLVIWYDSTNTVQPDSIDSFVRHPIRLIDTEELSEYFEDGQVFFANDDNGDDDHPGGENELPTTTGFVEGTRYQVQASIEDASDVDRYKIKTPLEFLAGAEWGRLSLRSLDANMNPEIVVYDQAMNELATSFLIHNSETLVVQAGSLDPNEDYFVEIRATGTGTYEFLAQLGVAPIQRTTLTNNQLDTPADVDRHRLTVGRPQLFHFSLEVANTSASDVNLELQIVNQTGQVVTRFVSAASDTRTAAIFLPSGGYRVVVRALTAAPFTNLGYSITASSIDDPLGPRSNQGTVPFLFEEDARFLVVAVLFAV